MSNLKSDFDIPASLCNGLTNEDQSGTKVVYTCLTNEDQSGTKVLYTCLTNEDQSGTKVVYTCLTNEDQSGTKVVYTCLTNGGWSVLICQYRGGVCYRGGLPV